MPPVRKVAAKPGQAHLHIQQGVASAASPSSSPHPFFQAFTNLPLRSLRASKDGAQRLTRW